MRIALVNPPSSFLVDSAVHPPLGLFHLASVLQLANHDVDYCDLGLGDKLPGDADVYAVTGTSPQLSDVTNIVRQIKQMGKPCVIGGPHASASPVDMVEAGADIVVCGEGEDIILRALEAVNSADGIVITANRIRDLDRLPFADRSQARRYKYWIQDRTGTKREASTIVTSRGCTARCAFCSHAVWKNTVRLRSADSVVTEVRQLKERHGYSALHVFDDSIAISKRRLYAICEGLKPLGLAWRCFIRSDQVDAEILKGMADAGCVEVGIGVESGSDEVLMRIQKGETVEQQRQAIRWAKQAGIRVKAFIIIALPGEDWRTLDETSAFLAETKPDDCDFTVLQLLPGSNLYANPQAYGLTVTDGPTWYKGKKGQYVCNHRTEGLDSDQILVARDYMEARYRAQN